MATKIRLDADVRFLCIQTMQTSSGWTVNPMLNFWVRLASCFFSVLYYHISVTYENNLDRAAAAGYAHAGTRAILLRRVNVLLVKKVEELTLYILEQEARIAKLEAELANRPKTRRPR